MTQDPTEPMRRAMLDAQRTNPPRVREELDLLWSGDVYDSDELRSSYEVIGFLAPFVAVRRKSDGQKGSLMFQHNPRLYWGFAPDRS